MTARPSSARFYFTAALLLAASIAVQAARERGWQPYEPRNPLLWLHAGLPMKRLSLGYSALAADVYWMRAVVYYGGKRLEPESDRNFELLAPLLDMATTLDPQFKVAYRFGAIFLTEASPNGPSRPDLAIALLQRAMSANPSAWEYPYDIGFINYWWLHDYRQAAAWFERASRLPGSADWLKPMAATTLAAGGDRASSRFLWRQIAETSDVEWLITSAKHRLTQLDAMDQLDGINAAVERFTSRERRFPYSWQELAGAEHLSGLPVDPTGVLLALDPTSGRFELDRRSTLWPPPEAARGGPPP